MRIEEGEDGGEEGLLGAGVFAEVGTDEHEGLKMGVGGTVGDLIAAVAEETLQHVTVLEEGLKFYLLALGEGKGGCEGGLYELCLLAFALGTFELCGAAGEKRRRAALPAAPPRGVAHPISTHL